MFVRTLLAIIGSFVEISRKLWMGFEPAPPVEDDMPQHYLGLNALKSYAAGSFGGFRFPRLQARAARLGYVRWP